MNPLTLYDKTNPLSIEAYAQKLIGHTFEDILDWKTASGVQETPDYGNSSRKGGLGNLIEEQYFGYKSNSDSTADFKEAGVELKATPYEVKRNGELRAGERLVLTMINYNSEIDIDFDSSHFWSKCKLLLLIYYFRDKNITNNLLYKIDYVKLFTPTSVDLAIIKQDYEIIINKILAGKAHELSESDTLYLGACTKGATALSSTVPQYYPPHTPARKRAFSYKNSYMTFVLNQYIIQDITTYEPIVTDTKQLLNTTFESFVVSKINQYIGKSDKELCLLFDREYNNNKSQWIDLAYRMLNIKSNKAQEFLKANIVVKALRIEENGTLKESSSLPHLTVKELLNEDWDDSSLNSYFEETKFLFVVYRKNNLLNNYVLKGCQLWNMPYNDLNEIVYSGWQNIKSTLETGLLLTKKYTKKGVEISNNLPKKSSNAIIHLRPHTSKRFYKLEDGEIVGDGTYANGDELPDGRWITKQSFWLNNSYVLSQLDDKLK